MARTFIGISPLILMAWMVTIAYLPILLLKRNGGRRFPKEITRQAKTSYKGGYSEAEDPEVSLLLSIFVHLSIIISIQLHQIASCIIASDILEKACK